MPLVALSYGKWKRFFRCRSRTKATTSPWRYCTCKAVERNIDYSAYGSQTFAAPKSQESFPIQVQ